MDINIPDNPEKRNFRGLGSVKSFFIPALIILVAIGAFGLGKLNKIEQSRVPITIEYTTSTPGNAKAPAGAGQVAGTSSAQTSNSVTTAHPIRRVYVASRTGTSYYLPSCTAAKRILEKNQVWFETKAEAEKAGYKPAANCKGI